jgi:hypothetical protein
VRKEDKDKGKKRKETRRNKVRKNKKNNLALKQSSRKD